RCLRPRPTAPTPADGSGPGRGLRPCPMSPDLHDVPGPGRRFRPCPMSPARADGSGPGVVTARVWFRPWLPLRSRRAVLAGSGTVVRLRSRPAAPARANDIVVGGAMRRLPFLLMRAWAGPPPAAPAARRPHDPTAPRPTAAQPGGPPAVWPINGPLSLGRPHFSTPAAAVGPTFGSPVAPARVGGGQ